MKKLFFNKNLKTIEDAAREIVNPNGTIKVDPTSNIRTAGYTIGGKMTEEILKEASELTVKNNLDRRVLKSSIFNDGYDSSKQMITAMSLADYLRGKHNRVNIKNVYADDVKFLERVDAIVGLLETETDEKTLNRKLHNLEGYYVVVGGNTRVSLILNCYYSNKEAFERDGSMDTIIPISVVTYETLNLSSKNWLEKNDKYTDKDSYDASMLAQIMWNAAVYADNKLSAARNIPCEVNILGKGQISKLMVENAHLALGNERNISAIRAIRGFGKMTKEVGLNQQELTEALLYRNIYNYFKDYDGSTLSYNWLEDLTFTVKVMVNAMTAKETEFKYQSKLCDRIGLDVSTFEITNEKRIISFINWCCEMHSLKKAAGSYLGKPIRKYLMLVDDKKSNKITEATFKKAKDAAKQAFVNTQFDVEDDAGATLADWLSKAKDSVTGTIEIRYDQLEKLIKAIEAGE